MPVENTDSCSDATCASVSALYIHIPFCARKCGYCGFYSEPCCAGSPDISRYASAVSSYISRCESAGLLSRVETVYIGGGTPTLLGDWLPRLVAQISNACPQVIEFSVEANPDSLTSELAKRLKASGCTRVSMGVQSMDDHELKGLGRIHDSHAAMRAAKAVVDAGLDLSCDLMCGIPGQTAASWQASLLAVIQMGAGHVSCYPLSIEEGTPFDDMVLAGKMSVPDSDFQADCMIQAARTLAEAGFERYEVASYARQGRECRHNIAYWSGKTYLGVGPGASSMLNNSQYALLKGIFPLHVEIDTETKDCTDPNESRFRLTVGQNLQEFFAAEDHGLACEVEVLNPREAAAEDLMLAMRMVKGASTDELSRYVLRGIPQSVLDMAISRALQSGLVETRENGNLCPTQKGWLLGNELFGIMWETAEDA